MKSKLYLIIPCYNEQEVLPRTMEVLSQKMLEMIECNLISSESRIVFVDDGSTDHTWRIIENMYNNNMMFCGIRLPQNEGQKNALMAGMMYAMEKCDCIISLDADLQDDVNILPEFIKKFRQGYHIVYGVRNDRSTDSWLKEHTAMLFYSLMNLLGTDIVRNHSEYRLLSDKALHALAEYQDSKLFLRYIIPRLGFDGAIVYYARQKREAGKTKYSVWKLVRLAVDAIVSSQIYNRRNRRR